MTERGRKERLGAPVSPLATHEMDKSGVPSSAPIVKSESGLSQEDERIREFQNNPNVPADAKVMALLLRSSGVTDYDPKIINQLLDFMHRYLTDLIVDAEDFRAHADKRAIDMEDIKLAIHTRVAHSFIQPPPRQVMVEMARQRNSQPIPTPPSKDGCVFLPGESDRLTNPGYQVEIQSEPSNRMDVTQ